MAKRFTDTELWDKDKFNSASTETKLLTFFIFSKCDCIGIFKMARPIIQAYLGFTVSEDDILNIPLDICKIGENKFWLIKFCDFQYGELKETCKPHKKYIQELKNNNLYERVLKGYCKGIDTLQEKEKDKDKEKEKEKEEEQPPKKKSIPEEFLKAYKIFPGTKSLTKNFETFTKKHKDWKEQLPKLEPAILREKTYLKNKLIIDGFAPDWRNFSTWLGNGDRGRGWEDVFPKYSEEFLEEARKRKAEKDKDSGKDPKPTPARNMSGFTDLERQIANAIGKPPEYVSGRKIENFLPGEQEVLRSPPFNFRKRENITLTIGVPLEGEEAERN